MHHARTIHRQCLDGCPSYVAIASPYGKEFVRDTTHTKVAYRTFSTRCGWRAIERLARSPR
jgi:hypothetical protein